MVTVKIRHLAEISPAMTMTVVIVMVVAQLVVLMVVQKAVQTVNLISQLTDLNAVIQLGMSLVLTV